MVHRTHAEELLRDGRYLNALPVLPDDVDASLAADAVMKVWAEKLPGRFGRGTQLKDTCSALPVLVVEEVLRRLEKEQSLLSVAIRSSVLAAVREGHPVAQGWSLTLRALELLEVNSSRPQLPGRLDNLRWMAKERTWFVNGLRAAVAVTSPAMFAKYPWRQQWMALLITAGGEETADALLPHVAAIIKPSEPDEDFTVEIEWVAACAATDAATVELLKALEANVDARRAQDTRTPASPKAAR